MNKNSVWCSFISAAAALQAVICLHEFSWCSWRKRYAFIFLITLHHNPATQHTPLQRKQPNILMKYRVCNEGTTSKGSGSFTQGDAWHHTRGRKEGVYHSRLREDGRRRRLSCRGSGLVSHTAPGLRCHIYTWILMYIFCSVPVKNNQTFLCSWRPR